MRPLFLLSVLGVVTNGILVTAVSINVSLPFNWEVTERLERVGNASTLDVAQKELNIALQNIEERGLTTGNTGVFFKGPSTDISYWYSNLKKAEVELESLKTEIEPVNISNYLLKLRETVGDNTENGYIVTLPGYLGFYPHQRAFFVWWIASFFSPFLALIVFIVEDWY